MDSRQQGYYNQIKVIVESKGGKVISDRYTKMVDKMLFQCENSHQWDTEARSIIKGIWCRYCHGNTKEQGEMRFKKRVAEKGGYIIGKYIGNHDTILIQCHLGHQWEVIPHNLAQGKWCPACGYENHGNGPERFFRTVEERKGKVLGQYINARTRIQVECEKGHIWNPKPYYVVIGNWCQTCTGSSGENIIAGYLANKGIMYEYQTSIPGLPRKRYDFIINYKGRNIVIEYDGEMHFKFNAYYHVNLEFFKHRQAVDRVKTLHAFNNGCRIIRIDYTQLLNITNHLDIALESNDPLYVSTPLLYQDWLIGKFIPVEEMISVYNGCSRPDYVPKDEVNEMTDKLITLTV